MECPKCRNKMEVNDIIIDDKKEKIEIYKCSKCGYTYIEEDELEKTVMYLKHSKIDNNKVIKDEISKYNVISKIKEKREEKGIRIKDLAERIGVMPQRIYQIETLGQNITITNALMIAKALDCDINEIYQLVKEEDIKKDMVIVKKNKKYKNE